MSSPQLKTGLVLMKQDINYLVAKLEEIHEDVKQLQIHVDELRQEAAGRKAVQRWILGTLATLGTIVGWLANHLLTFTRGGGDL